MRTIAVVNQKGGCGKTTVAINLASSLAEAGQRTLLVDMDPQAHCAVGLAVPEDQIEQSIYDVLISRSRNEPMKLTEILWQISDRLQLAPASIDLSAYEQQMTGIADRECCLMDVIAELKDDYDYTLIDCPPAVGLLTFSALRAATDVIVPVETGYFALHGLSKQLETLSILCERSNQQVNVRVLASMYDIRTKMAREVLAELRKHFEEKMFKTIVNFNTKIKEAASLGQPISEYDPASKGRRDFYNLAEEIISSHAKLQRHEFVNSLADQLEAISATADELLMAAKQGMETAATTAEQVNPSLEHSSDEIHQDQTSEAPEEQEPLDIEAKLADFYGVSQIEDAIVFTTLYPRANTIQIAGDFNNWQPSETPMEKVAGNGAWQIKLKLPAGKYRYRLVVDGQWQQDPYNEMTEMNPYGDYNSVLEVK
jgi:chromosome partitioning protein